MKIVQPLYEVLNYRNLDQSIVANLNLYLPGRLGLHINCDTQDSCKLQANGCSQDDLVEGAPQILQKELTSL